MADEQKQRRKAMTEVITLTASFRGADFEIRYGSIDVIRELLSDPEVMARIGKILEANIKKTIDSLDKDK